ncbi:SGNH/GDSL hydrolase family protein [Candidatus Marinimicrobia bacterium]|nr:SGNH/GDSL hydrolase family protein [Candidatus Neomarinimicrobiota bacterium]
MEIHSLLHNKSSGLPFPESKREHPFDRLPEKFRKKVRKEVWDLSKNTSGISIDFSTNSSFIELHWEVLNNFAMNHMPNTGIKGLDLYIKLKDRWTYAGTGIPDGKKNKLRIIKDLKTYEREYRLYLPLYDGIKTLDIGLNTGSTFKEVKTKKKSKPLVFYGTSITQGGCASRPGLAHTNIVSRDTGLECLNFGFSGNGCLEENIGNILSKIDAKLFIIECMQNVSVELIKERLISLVTLIRKNQDAPIVLMSEPQFKYNDLNQLFWQDQIAKNRQLEIEYKNLKKNNISNIYMIDEPHAIGEDDEGTIDGVHFNDLGFQRYAHYLTRNLKSLELI